MEDILTAIFLFGRMLCSGLLFKCIAKESDLFTSLFPLLLTEPVNNVTIEATERRPLNDKLQNKPQFNDM